MTFHPKQSESSNTELKNIITSMGLYSVWIGINDVASNGIWVDSDGNAFGSGIGDAFTAVPGRYTNWHLTNWCGTEPNNCGAGEEYVTIVASNGFWHDDYSDSRDILCIKPVAQSKILIVEQSDCSRGVCLILVDFCANFDLKYQASFISSQSSGSMSGTSNVQ